MRMVKEATLSCFLDALNFFFTDSGVLVPNFTALVKTLLTGQLPSKRLRIEHELPRYGDTLFSHNKFCFFFLQKLGGRGETLLVFGTPPKRL